MRKPEPPSCHTCQKKTPGCRNGCTDYALFVVGNEVYKATTRKNKKQYLDLERVSIRRSFICKKQSGELRK